MSGEFTSPAAGLLGSGPAAQPQDNPNANLPAGENLPPAGGPETLSRETVDAMDAALAPPATPAGYVFQYEPEPGEGFGTDPAAAEGFKLDMKFREVAHAAGWDQGFAGATWKTVMESAKAPVSDEAHNAAVRATEQRLRQVWGDDFEAKTRLAREEFARIAQQLPPGVAWWAAEFGGLGTSEHFIRGLVLRAERRQARGGK